MRFRLIDSAKAEFPVQRTCDVLGVSLKSEFVWRTIFHTRPEAEQAIARHIDGFYDPVRRHSALAHVSRVQFEKLAEN